MDQLIRVTVNSILKSALKESEEAIRLYKEFCKIVGVSPKDDLKLLDFKNIKQDVKSFIRSRMIKPVKRENWPSSKYDSPKVQALFKASKGELKIWEARRFLIGALMSLDSSIRDESEKNIDEGICAAHYAKTVSELMKYNIGMVKASSWEEKSNLTKELDKKGDYLEMLATSKRHVESEAFKVMRYYLRKLEKTKGGK